ncbi:hypothetical protein H6S82_29185 [Planktothrix sp. FACHB-1355]|uniref:Uncharacterized protein n=1 Tax=Aerosakkonema funiforme FACHB-1375 TaxID=2949571 RepID=A0A926ZLQ3_9CYAN|nr:MULTISPECIES: hypothetical protein [Oscillatoriales]MBD2185301.1 hypothetical protein [Aerosakkonema funiforme FACHB-1375]MBD3562886.1 hypothetical protein [Planktothrix sp. FACHB-1355]
MQKANSSLEYQLLRQQLGQFLFGKNEIKKRAEMLSGSELARLAIATITAYGLSSR